MYQLVLMRFNLAFLSKAIAYFNVYVAYEILLYERALLLLTAAKGKRLIVFVSVCMHVSICVCVCL